MPKKQNHFVSTAKRPRIPIWPIVFTMKAFSSPLMTKVLGEKFSNVLLLIENGTCEYFLYDEEIKNLGDSFLKKLEKNSSQTKIYIKNLQLHGERLLNFAQAIDLSKSNETLAAYLKQYEILYSRLLVFGWPLVIVGEPVLIREIKNSLEKIISGVAERDRVFHIISNPVFSSYTTRERIDLIKLALKTKSRNAADEVLKKVAKKYQWTCFDYTGPAHTQEYFADELKALLKNNREELKKELREILERPRKAKIALNAIFKKYNFPKELVAKIRALQDLIYLRDKRKEFLTKTHFLMEKLLDEISRREKIDKELLRWLPTEELISLVLCHKFELKKIKERIRYSAVLCIHGKDKIFYKERAKKYFDLTRLNGNSLREIKGVCACSGKVKARAKIILTAKDGYLLKRGEILVTTMTTVDFTPIIKKAAGIITDEGGLTSHAAVISREFKIPCVVGTRIATKKINDGDLVEMDAGNGSIKKIN